MNYPWMIWRYGENGTNIPIEHNLFYKESAEMDGEHAFQNIICGVKQQKAEHRAENALECEQCLAEIREAE